MFDGSLPWCPIPHPSLGPGGGSQRTGPEPRRCPVARQQRPAPEASGALSRETKDPGPGPGQRRRHRQGRDGAGPAGQGRGYRPFPRVRPPVRWCWYGVGGVEGSPSPCPASPRPAPPSVWRPRPAPPVWPPCAGPVRWPVRWPVSPVLSIGGQGSVHPVVPAGIFADFRAPRGRGPCLPWWICRFSGPPTNAPCGQGIDDRIRGAVEHPAGHPAGAAAQSPCAGRALPGMIAAAGPGSGGPGHGLSRQQARNGRKHDPWTRQAP